MPSPRTIAILGVGLIGGSIGRALLERQLAERVIGIGRNAGRLRKAKDLGLVTETTTKLARGVATADLVIVCTPVDQVVDHVRQVAESASAAALITDVGSTKTSIVDALEGALPAGGARFLGSHPLAGSEKTGAEHALPDLLQGRVVVLTPTRTSLADDYETLRKFWESLGARVVRRTPAAHDAALAATSHLPHLIASALAAATPEEELELTAGGWCDSTRIAGGDVELWRQILADNRGNVLRALEKFEKVLASFRAALEKDDRARLAKLLEAGKAHRDIVGS